VAHPGRRPRPIKLGTLLAFLIYIRDFFRPLDDLSEKSNVLQAAMASGERVFGLMDTDEAILDPEPRPPPPACAATSRSRRCGSPTATRTGCCATCHLHIPAGTLAGHRGRHRRGQVVPDQSDRPLLRHSAGAVKVDGVDVRAYRQADLRRRIGIVLQDPFIFPGSLADNISLLNPAA
jgi:ATP-binding cassette subfamily B multidrug efflux pump